jgi:hypothetical protein
MNGCRGETRNIATTETHGKHDLEYIGRDHKRRANPQAN